MTRALKLGKYDSGAWLDKTGKKPTFYSESSSCGRVSTFDLSKTSASNSGETKAAPTAVAKAVLRMKAQRPTAEL